MAKITYKTTLSGDIAVWLDGKRVGSIMAAKGGYQYWPMGNSTPGEIMPTVDAVKKTLESD